MWVWGERCAQLTEFQHILKKVAACFSCCLQLQKFFSTSAFLKPKSAISLENCVLVFGLFTRKLIVILPSSACQYIIVFCVTLMKYILVSILQYVVYLQLLHQIKLWSAWSLWVLWLLCTRKRDCETYCAICALTRCWMTFSNMTIVTFYSTKSGLSLLSLVLCWCNGNEWLTQGPACL